MHKRIPQSSKAAIESELAREKVHKRTRRPRRRTRRSRRRTRGRGPGRRYTLRTTLRRAVRHRDERIPLDLHEVATLLSVSDKTVQRKVMPSLMVGARPRYLWADVERQLRQWSRPAQPEARRRSRPAAEALDTSEHGHEHGPQSVDYWLDQLED